jgi:cell division protein FtsW
VSQKLAKFQDFYYDYWIVVLTLIIISIGLILLASASMGISDKLFHNPFHFLFRQSVYAIIGVIFGFFIIRLPLSWWEKISIYLLFIVTILLFLVLIPGVGKAVNGSTRWFGLGAFTIQPSEFAKVAVVLYIADYLTRRQDEIRDNIIGFVKPMLLLGAIDCLLLLEPDFGAVAVITLSVLGMLFLAKARLWQFMVLLLLVAACLGGLAISSPYRLMRITSFLDPWAKPFDSGYQLTQSLIAFGRGGTFGLGLGNGIQKLFYLPEAHTDFLFAVLAEELGVVGQMVVLGLFSLLIGRILYIGRIAGKIGNVFATYVANGLGLILGLQVIVNVGVNVGLLPTKGLTLPLMSYGGSSMMFSCVIIAILLRIYHEQVKQRLSF